MVYEHFAVGRRYPNHCAFDVACHVDDSEETIKKMAEITKIDTLDFKAKKTLTSAFRRIIGNGLANNITATYNHRALRHVIEMRTSHHAEEEIRLLFNKVFELVGNRYPSIYGDAELTMIDGYNEIIFKHGKV